MDSIIYSAFIRSAEVKQAISSNSELLSKIKDAAKLLVQCKKQGGTIYSCGNGGSACDAIHFTEELVARYKKERPGIRAMHLMDPAALTCWSNDYNFESAFARQVNTFCTPKDLLVAFSTSGRSKNVLAAVDAAKKLGTKSIGLTGKDGGTLKDQCDLSVVIPSNDTERIQEAHITIVHIFAEILDT